MTLETASLTPSADTGDTRHVLDDMLSSFETFKQANDARLDEIEKRGSADVLLEEKVDRINNRLTQLTTAIQRPPLAAHDAVEPEVKAAFNDYIRHGEVSRELKSEISTKTAGAITSLSTDAASVFVPDYFEQRLTQHIADDSAFARLATTQIIPVAQDIDYISHDSELAAAWVGETAARPMTDRPALNKVTLPMGELYANPAVTQNFFDDASIDVEEWLINAMSQAFSGKENSAFLNGTGTNQPKGLLSTDTMAEASDGSKIQSLNTGDANGLKKKMEYDFLLQLAHALPTRYRAKASWMMSAKTHALLRTIKDNAGTYIWSPSIDYGQAKIFGYPVNEEAHFPDIAENGPLCCFGDFSRAYMITRPPQTRLIRDPYSNKPYLQFYATRRVGGAVIDPRAVILAKVAA